LYFHRNMALEQALYHITGVEQLADVNSDDLLALANNYPYFAPTQFLLGLKLKTEGSFAHVAQLQKSLMYFSNPMWMHLQLAETSIFEDILSNEENKTVEAKSTITNYTIPYTSSSTSNEDLFKPAFDNEEVEAGFTFPSFQEEKEVEAGFKFPSADTEAASTHESVSTPNQEESLLQNPVFETNNFNASTTNKLEIPTLESVRELLEGKKATVKATSSIVEETKESTISNNASTTPIPSYTFKGFGADDDINGANAVAISEAAYQQDEAEEIDEQNNDSSVDFTNNISSVLTNQLVDFNKPIEKDTKLEFENEALHTVDYFAALGIKIDLTKQPQDKLTVQLRRFTDWLKQMKNVNPNPQDLGTDPELEKAIQNIAKTSIEAREIVTETMADVFIKQGKVDKAIQLYIKLSFLDPHKSTYFANRIQQLKGI